MQKPELLRIKSYLDAIVGERNPFSSPAQLKRCGDYIAEQFRHFQLTVSSEPVPFEASGGTDSLAEWAKNNPDKYYPMLVRTLLKEVKPKEKSLVDMHVSILEVNAARRGAGMKEVEE